MLGVLWSSSQAALSCNASRGPAPQLVCKFSMSYDLEDDGRQGLQEDDLLEDAEVDTLVREAIAQALGETHFKHEMVLNWTNGIIEGCLKKLAVLAKPFKYVVTCSLSQKVRKPCSPPAPTCHLLSSCQPSNNRSQHAE